MKRVHVLVVALVLSVAGAAAGQEGTASLEGKVTDSSGVGVNRATVALVGGSVTIGIGQRLASSFMATTSTNGTFDIVGITPGRYRLLVDKAGYVRQAFGAGPTSTEGSIVTINRDDRKRGIVVEITALATLSGVARDHLGEPLNRAMIRVYRRGYARGEAVMVSATATVTDAVGEYKVTVPPGEYYVAVVPVSEPPVQGMRYATTYFPGVIQQELAAPVSAAAGSIVTAIDINLVRTTAVKVTGRLETGRNPGAVVIATSRELYSPQAATVAAVQSDGSFSMPGIVPASYKLVVASGLELTRVYGWLDLDVFGPDDVTNVMVPAFAQFDLPMRIVVTGGAGTDLSGVSVVMSPLGFRNAFSSGSSDPGGRLVLEKMVPTVYQLRLQNLSKGTYPSSINLAGRSFRSGAIDLSAVSANTVLEVDLASDAGTVTGTVRARRDSDEPVRAIVTLVPRAASDAGEDHLYRRVTTDDRGGFVIDDVPPRDYDVVAWESLDGGAERSAEVLSKVKKTTVTVRPRATAAVTLEMTPQP